MYLGFITQDPAVGGFDLRGVATNPVSLTIPNKVMYSAHIYPSTIGGEPYDNGQNMYDQFNVAWGFILINNIAPMYIGECGASLDGGGEDDDTAAKLADEQVWAASLLAYCNGNAPGGPTFSSDEQGISTSWWAWGNFPGESPDGVISGAGWNWQGAPKTQQQAVYSQLQYTTIINAPTSSPPTPTPTFIPSPDDTVVKAGSSASITDNSGNVWTLTSDAVIAVNGVADTTTANVAEIAFVGGLIWQEVFFP
jgi:hypothetical protein